MTLPIILTVLCAGVALTLVALRASWARSYARLVDRLFDALPAVPPGRFDGTRLSELPSPVERYFRHVLREGQSRPGHVRLKYDGWFKTALDKPWIAIRGDQYFTTSPPGFVWRGVTRWFTATDSLVHGRGRLVVGLFSMFDVVDGQGPAYDSGEVLRWMSENIWFPTSLLPGGGVAWEAIDDVSAKLTREHRGQVLSFKVGFNDAGEIATMETRRAMDAEREETWVVKCSNYKTLGGMTVPTECVALWRLADGDHEYAKFTVRRLEYGVLYRFGEEPKATLPI